MQDTGSESGLKQGDCASSSSLTCSFINLSSFSRLVFLSEISIRSLLSSSSSSLMYSACCLNLPLSSCTRLLPGWYSHSCTICCSSCITLTSCSFTFSSLRKPHTSFCSGWWRMLPAFWLPDDDDLMSSPKGAWLAPWIAKEDSPEESIRIFMLDCSKLDCAFLPLLLITSLCYFDYYCSIIYESIYCLPDYLLLDSIS